MVNQFILICSDLAIFATTQPLSETRNLCARRLRMMDYSGAHSILNYIRKIGIFQVCESPHTETGSRFIHYALSGTGDRPISKDDAFDDCVILPKESFDPDAVFLGDIVDDAVLPYANLAVDGLNSRSDAADGKLELRPEDVAANEAINASTTMPVATLNVDHLEVYGWESSWWRKIKGYLGF